MRQMMFDRLRRSMLSVTCLMALGATTSWSQSAEISYDCEKLPQSTNGVRYSIDSRHYSSGSSASLELSVSLAPEKFNQEDLARLACKLQREFAKENVINVLLFDDKRAAKSLALYLTDQRNHGIYLWHLRGRYEFDRGKSLNYVEYVEPDVKDELLALERVRILIRSAAAPPVRLNNK